MTHIPKTLKYEYNQNFKLASAWHSRNEEERNKKNNTMSKQTDKPKQWDNLQGEWPGLTQ